jgi:tRNA threonylcarbamoyladenosine biosynthesis protein TsaB
MTSLRQVLATHDTALVLDAASSRIQIGWFTRDAAPRWYATDEEAGTGLFRGIDALGTDVTRAAAFIYCDGPGSILGVRTAAMALRTWNVLQPRPVFGYCSLALVAHALGSRDIAVIADARRESWHCYRGAGPLRRVPTGELTGDLVMPEHFRHWSAVPAGVRTVPYSLPDLLPATADFDLLQPTDAPDAFLHEEPSYVTWRPRIHRAPAAP